MEVVCGYERITQMNRFLDKGVQSVLNKKINKDSLVCVTDFIIGNDYCEVASPFLVNGLQAHVKRRGVLRQDPQYMLCKIISQIMLIEKKSIHKNFTEKYKELAYFMRLVMLYPLNKIEHIKLVVKKCDEFKKTLLTVLKEVSPYGPHSYVSSFLYHDTPELYEKRITETEKIVELLASCKEMYINML